MTKKAYCTILLFLQFAIVMYATSPGAEIRHKRPAGEYFIYACSIKDIASGTPTLEIGLYSPWPNIKEYIITGPNSYIRNPGSIKLDAKTPAERRIVNGDELFIYKIKIPPPFRKSTDDFYGYMIIYAVDTDGKKLGMDRINLFNNGFCRETFWCFGKNTLVLMADGTLRFIQDIKRGERVASFDFRNNKRVTTEVVKITSAISETHLIINSLTVTEHHPFAIGRDEWKEAGDLCIGDTVVGLNNDVTIKETTKLKEDIDVYDLSVAPFSNFYVFNGESFFLVHNKD